MGLNEKFFKSAAAAPTGSTYFDTALYTGNGGTQSITSLNFQPDLVWIKKRSSASTGDHMLFDSVRGVDKVIISNSTQAEYNGGGAGYQTSFDSNGFSITSNAFVNQSSATYVAWNWKAANSTSSGAASGFTNVTKSVNSNGGFSIVKFTRPSGTWPVGTTYEHGLSSDPQLSIVKDLTDSDNWYVFAEPIGTSKYLTFTSDAQNNFALFPTVNGTSIGYRPASFISNAKDHISYNFCDVTGVQKIGSYTGTGAANKQITTGFQPSFLMIKNSTTGSTGWLLLDTARDGTTENGNALFANSSGAEWGAGNTTVDIDFTATGFTIQNGYVVVNGGSDTYIYLAIA
jgi:hypothetical protein